MPSLSLPHCPPVPSFLLCLVSPYPSWEERVDQGLRPTGNVKEMSQRAAGSLGGVKQASLSVVQWAAELIQWLFHLFPAQRGAHPHVALTVLKIINYLVLGSG